MTVCVVVMRACVSEDSVGYLALPAGDSSQRSKIDLSEREREVLSWVARGRSNKEIGQLLDISPRTVQHHVRHIYDKIGVSTRAEAITIAWRQRLVDLPGQSAKLDELS